MRSRLSTLAVIALIGSSSPLAGCGGGDGKAMTPQSPTPSGYPEAMSESDVQRVVVQEPASSFADEDRAEAPKKVAMAPPSPPPPSPPPGDASGSTPAAQPPARATTPSEAMKPEKPDPTKEPAQNRDLVIYTARFTMAVYQVDQGLTAVEKIARDNGGYLGTKKDREITVRIPRGRFETTLAAVDKIGDVLHREIQAQDVTDEHVDLQIRIKNARAMQQRLSDLLTRASVKDALEIEKELHRVTEELERLEGRMKVLKDKVAFSTITVAFEARGARIVTTRARLPFPWLGALSLPSLLSLSEEK